MLNTSLLVLPIFVVVFFGYFLKRFGYIDDVYVKSNNKLIFNFFLPLLLFYEISKTAINAESYLLIIIVMVASIFTIFIFSFLFGKVLKMPQYSLGTFAMNNFRANYAYMGLPISFYAFGKEGLSIGSILMAVIVPFVNLLSVVALSIGKKSDKSKLMFFIQSTLINPIAFSCILGLIFSYFKVELPVFITRSIDIVSKVALPLALIGIGATINFNYIRGNKFYLLMVVIIKLFVLPFVALSYIYLFNIKLDIVSKVLIVMLASPPATVNFVLADMMGGDKELSSGAIMLSTLMAIFSFIFWLTVLKV
ncbi:AEC family transporter [Calditerrivibrio sp.]|uniref:AEC family transporter n=1 Tax=Calditerrivibrio sp. TaxID=2792612 RepID=UPI003D0F0A45